MSSKNEMEDFLLSKGSPETTQFVDKNLLITQQIFKFMEERGWSQKDLAHGLGKSEAEVSKWLSGVHNLTLKSITKLETVFGEDVITTPAAAKQQYEKVHFVKVNVYASVNQVFIPGLYNELKEESKHVNLKIRRA